MAACAAVVVVLGAICFARFVLRPPGPPTLDLLEDDATLAADVAAGLLEVERSLADAGLRRLGRVRVHSAAHVTAYATVLASDDGLVVAQGVVHAVRVGRCERIVARCVELSTRLETDGGSSAVLVTSNAPRHALTDRLVSYWRFPLCRDAGALLRIHRAIMAADGRTPAPLPGSPGAWVSRLTEDGEQTWRALADAGMVARGGQGEWRYTWRFAISEAAGSLWPVSRLRERQDRAEARALLETVWLGALWRTG